MEWRFKEFWIAQGDIFEWVFENIGWGTFLVEFVERDYNLVISV